MRKCQQGRELLKCAATHWATDRAATIGAALAFYCAFSLAPLLIIVVTLTGWIVGAQVAEQQLDEQLRALFGPATAGVLITAMDSAQNPRGACRGGLYLARATQPSAFGAEFTACLGGRRSSEARAT